MTQALRSFFLELASAPDERTLRTVFLDGVSRHFGVQRWGLYLRDPVGELASFDVVGVSDAFVESYERHGRQHDRVLEHVLAHHTPAHEGMVYPSGGWTRSALYKTCCASHDHAHVLTGPVVGEGRLIGTIHFARIHGRPAFDEENLLRLAALGGHVSACLAALRHRPGPPAAALERLTAREGQIARMAARGLTVEAIAASLWISPNTVKQSLRRSYRKLGVRNRAELTSRLLKG